METSFCHKNNEQEHTESRALACAAGEMLWMGLTTFVPDHQLSVRQVTNNHSQEPSGAIHLMKYFNDEKMIYAIKSLGYVS